MCGIGVHVYMENSKTRISSIMSMTSSEEVKFEVAGCRVGQNRFLFLLDNFSLQMDMSYLHATPELDIYYST